MQVTRYSILSSAVMHGMFLLLPFMATSQTVSGLKLQYVYSNESNLISNTFKGPETEFQTTTLAEKYLKQLPDFFLKKGYPAASVDSIIKTDSLWFVHVYTGPLCQQLNLSLSAKQAWMYDAGLPSKSNNFVSIDFYRFLLLREKILAYYENHGHPFATVSLDSASWDNNNLNALLTVDEGLFYPIDSISVSGKVSIKNEFLQRYLGIMNSSGYSKKTLSQVDKKLNDLSFLSTQQPSSVTMLGTGAVLNLYLKNKKTNQVNFLLGIMPASQNSNRTLITGDINLDLKNMLSSGERIIFKWQQLQPKSPRLVLGFNRPYILHSPFALDVNFDMFKKDSNFLRINARTGCGFEMKSGQSGSVFLQFQQHALLPGATDTSLVKSTKRLPDNADMRSSAIGLSYFQNNTDNRMNPRKGNQIEFTGTAGLKKISKNNDILGLTESGFDFATLYDSVRMNTYQIRCRLNAARFFPLGKNATLKTTVNGGLYYSPDIFRNDLFQIGGASLLRGFDEESIYATRYVVLSAEYRLLFGGNSYLCFFSDYGLTDFSFQDQQSKHDYLGAGIGLQYQTKGGLLNVSYATGKTSGLPFNISQSSKIHFGYVNYF